MNSIDILEKELKELCKSGKRIKIEDMKRIFVACDLIENLIAENKELKEKNKKLEVINKMQEYRISVIDERELISKSKVEELLKEIQEEGEIVYKNFMTKKLEEDFEIDGAILQELGYIEGKLQSLLGKE